MFTQLYIYPGDSIIMKFVKSQNITVDLSSYTVSNSELTGQYFEK